MTKLEMITQINDILAEEFEVDIEEIKVDLPLMKTLALDSLDMVDMVVLINAKFSILLNESDFVEVVTFEDFYNLIAKKLDIND